MLNEQFRVMFTSGPLCASEPANNYMCTLGQGALNQLSVGGTQSHSLFWQ